MSAERRKWEETIHDLITKEPIKRELLVNYAMHYTNDLSQEMLDNMRKVDKNFLPLQLTVINNLENEDVTYDYTIEDDIELSYILDNMENQNIESRMYSVRMFLIRTLMFNKVAINFLITNLEFVQEGYNTKVIIKSRIKLEK